MCEIKDRVKALIAEVGADRVKLGQISAVAITAAAGSGLTVESVLHCRQGKYRIETKEAGPDNPIWV